MNAITHPDAMAPMPDADTPFIPVTVNGARYRVYHALGRPFWVSRAEPCGFVWPGRDVRDLAEGSNQAAAAAIAKHLLAGLNRAENWPVANDDAPVVLPFWKVAIGGVLFAAGALVLMWSVIIIAWAMRGGR